MRHMTAAIATFGLLVTLTASGRAQERHRADFSGTWVLEHAGGDLPERAVKAIVEGARHPITLAIVQSEGALRVTRDTDRGPETMAFPLDGSEVTHATLHGSMTSRTTWNGETLVTTGKRPLRGPFPVGTRQVEFVQTRTLSPDGARLTIEIQFRTPRGVRTRTATFRRAG